MADTTRTFVAIPLPDPVTAAISRLTTRLAVEMPGARWLTSSSLHLTLAFLGDVDQKDLMPVCQATAAAVRSIDPFSLRVAGLGAFPELNSPRVLWAGITGDALPQLSELHSAVSRAVKMAGYPTDERFTPHLTLARFKPGKLGVPDLTDVPGRFARWMAGDLLVGEVVTYSSTLTGDGPEYTPLARAPLMGASGKTPS